MHIRKPKEMHSLFSKFCIKHGGHMTDASSDGEGCIRYACEGPDSNSMELRVCRKR